MRRGPLGVGARPHPADGNALLLTRDGGGRVIRTYLWLGDFRTNVHLQVNTAQARDRVVHYPIRLQELGLQFSVLFTARKEGQYDRLIQRIKNHWAFNLNQGDLSGIVNPMTLRYYGANATYRGFIPAITKRVAWNDVLKEYQFTMRLITDQIPEEGARVVGTAPFLPTAQDVAYWGDAWYSLKALKIMDGEWVPSNETPFPGAGQPGKPLP